ncbi:DUF6058 family natural product biosynthesis protein [Undibacterium sp. TJN19]|uniref:DUF6058 family natural product biosynthesis protein n=1 Tax=Undibacterium sp. TJN19 TaxID=3413055 RepID=UPI003BF3BFF0
MSELDLYLKKYYLNKARFAAACDSTEAEIDALIKAQLLPAPSYVVTENATICSAVFGEMDAFQTSAGDYFHPAHRIWFNKAQQLIADYGVTAAPAHARQEFMQKFIVALTDLNRHLWQLPECFLADGTPVSAGLTARAEFSWQHFLSGTFGLCVANPVSEAAIAKKEILQEKLTHLTDNGSKTDFSSNEAKDLLSLIDVFSEAAMWFSPAEYHQSSRKRLVDDLKPRLLAIAIN